jgi:hypothetical protein
VSPSAKVSPPVKLCAFGLLLVVIFLTARAAGLSLGPVTTVYTRSGGNMSHMSPGMGGMNGMKGMNMFPSSPSRRGTQPSPGGSPSPSGSATPSEQKEP